MATVPESILFFIESGHTGGAEQVVLSLAEGFRDRGAEVAVVTLRTGWLTDSLAASDITHIHLRSERSLDVSLPFRLANICKERHASIIHSHLLDSTFYAALASKIARIPHIGTEHGDVHHTSRKKFARIKIGILRLLGTRVSAVSNFTATHLEKLGLSEKQVTCIGNPVQPSERVVGVRTKIRQSLGITEESADHWVWLHAARFWPVKDEATLLEGFARSRSGSRYKQTLLMIGDGPERFRLEKLCEKLEITEHVKFMGFREDMPELLMAGDGFILSSKSEALPMSLLEAAQAGLVLVSSDVGGVGDIIVDRQSGYLFPAGEPETLARVLQLVLNDSEQRRKIAQQGQTHVVSTFSVDHVLDRYQSEYQRLLKKQSGQTN